MISFVRVDNRLIHGQVVEAWLPDLKVSRVVVADDEAAAQPADPRGDGPGGPARVEVDILPLRGDSASPPRLQDGVQTLVLLRDVPAVVEARRARAAAAPAEPRERALRPGAAAGLAVGVPLAARSSAGCKALAGRGRGGGGARGSVRERRCLSRRWSERFEKGRQRAHARGLAPASRWRRLWGGLVALERRAFLQAMFSRPLVAATGDGAAAGRRCRPGSIVGMVLELFYLGTATSERRSRRTTRWRPRGTAAAAAAMAAQTGGGGTPAIWCRGHPALRRAGARSGACVDRRWSATRRGWRGTALELAEARRARPGGAAEPLGHVAATSSLFGLLTRPAPAAGPAARAAASQAPARRAARAGLGLPGDGLGGRGHRGAGLARPARGALAGWRRRRW